MCKYYSYPSIDNRQRKNLQVSTNCQLHYCMRLIKDNGGKQ